MEFKVGDKFTYKYINYEVKENDGEVVDIQDVDNKEMYSMELLSLKIAYEYGLIQER